MSTHKGDGPRQHVTDGTGCWCNPTVEHVEPTDDYFHPAVEPMRQVPFTKEGVESAGGDWLSPPDPVMVNISGRDEEPLWVQAHEVAAIGVRNVKDSLVVMVGSGMQLVARDISPSEVASLVCGVPLSAERADVRWLGR